MKCCWCPACATDDDWKESAMSKLEIPIKTMPETSLFVGSEGDICIRENGAVIRILTAEQAADLANALDTAARHSKGTLVGDGV